MSNPEEANSCVQDTQETFYEGTDETLKIVSETQNLNESQDFHLVDSDADESMERQAQTNLQKSLQQIDLPQPETLMEIDSNVINDKKDESVISKKESVEETKKNISDELYSESEKKEEHFDEDEVIQSTPPRSYSPSGKDSVDITSLKRKARNINEPPAKIARTTSMEDIKKPLEEEENHQSFDSDDSYQDLFKNNDKNTIIEETQDSTNFEYTLNSLKVPIEQMKKRTGDEKLQERDAEHVKQDEVLIEKCSDEKDENLNVSAKLNDINDNDSLIANIDSTNDSQLEDNLLITRQDVPSTSVIEKSDIGTLDETEPVNNTKKLNESNMQQSNRVKSTEKIIDDKEIPSAQTKSRISIELIYEDVGRTINDDKNKSKPQVVQIDDDGEKVVLDSSSEMKSDDKNTKMKPEVVQIDDSHEDGEKIVLDSLGKNSEIQTIDKSACENKSNTDFGYKLLESTKDSSLDSKIMMDKNLVNGNADSKNDPDITLSMDSDTLLGCEEQILSTAIMTATYNIKKTDKDNSFTSKDNIDVISISDNEISNMEEKNKSDLIRNSMAKTVQVEREIGMYMKVKYLMHMDESTKELVSKELIAVQCEPMVGTMSRQRNEDSQSSLADISDNKDSSPGSVNSNAQLYQLNPSRLSIMSSISSSSSGSSVGSFALKYTLKSDMHHFQMPLGPAKHAKKFSQDGLSDKQTLDETYDRLTREWKNHRLVATTVLTYANTELGNVANTIAATATITDTSANVSNERLDDHSHHLEKDNMRSSTPEQPVKSSKMEITVTPKSTKKGKAVKRPRNKSVKTNIMLTNGENKIDNIKNEPVAAVEIDTPSREKKNKTMSTEVSEMMSNSYVPDELIGKTVFARWSDKKYYPGTVSDRLKGKYKVNFYDGESKTLIPEFVIPIPKILREGLSVYATTKTNDYGSCGIIVNVHSLGDDEDVYYTVETDESERLRVQVRDIFLSADQAQVLKEEMDSTEKNSLPITPKALGQVTLDNMIDGKRRSKRIGTPVPILSTPKSKSTPGKTSTPTSAKAEPSVSGMCTKLKKNVWSENESMSSDSYVEPTRIENYDILMGIQEEVDSTSFEQTKGPLNKIKSKRSKKKEDPQIAILGPIPNNSDLFKGMSFILTCASLKSLDRYLDTKISTMSSTEAEATETDFETDFETENEEDWGRDFVRDRLRTQILAGGGKIYENFGEIPKDEYNNTMLITNVPNTTEKSILCLSAGIRVCNHKWIIQCCTEGKLVSIGDHALPNGWSFHKKDYIDRYDVSKNKPLSEVVVIIPSLASNKEFAAKWPKFAALWRQVCENAGAVVLIAENSGAMETMDFDSQVVISNKLCPLWAIDKAARQRIPVLSTTWVTQCIIEGKLCPYDQHPRYKYNYILN